MPSIPRFTEHSVPCGQGALHAREYPGVDPAFVLMHGLPDNLRIYDQLIPLLVASGRRVIAFDFLGFGASDKPVGASYSFAQQLGDLEAVIRHLGLESVVLVPHDSSGFAGLNFAREHPSQVAAVCMLNSAYADAPDVQWPEMIELAARPSLRALSDAMLQAQFPWLLGWQQEMFRRALPPEQRANFQSHIGRVVEENFMAQPSAAAAYAQLTAQFYEEIARNRAHAPSLAALDLPVRLIWGEHDPYLTLAMAEARLAQLKRGSLHPIAAGHWLQSDRPAEVARALLE